MKEWPKNNQPANLVDIVALLRKAVDFAYSLQRQNRFEDVPWDGLDVGQQDKHILLSPKEALSADSQLADLNQGRDVLDTILSIAVQLGIEQARRIAKQDDQLSLTALEMGFKLLKSRLIPDDQEFNEAIGGIIDDSLKRLKGLYE